MRRLERADWRSLATVAGRGRRGRLPIRRVRIELSWSSRDAQVGPDQPRRRAALTATAASRPPHAGPVLRRLSCSGSCSASRCPRRCCASPIPAPVQPAKPWTYGQAARLRLCRRRHAEPLRLRDHDAHDRSERAASELPPGWQARRRMRCGSESARRRLGACLPESGQPGAVLDCTTALGRRLSRERGTCARIRTATASTSTSRRCSPAAVRAGAAAASRPGTWDLSLPFVSQQAVDVRGGGLDVHLPPNLDRSGEHLAGGQGDEHGCSDRADDHDGRSSSDLVGHSADSVLRPRADGRVPAAPGADDPATAMRAAGTSTGIELG